MSQEGISMVVPICYRCGQFVEEDNLCLGCLEYFCIRCSVLPPEGQHTPDDHVIIEEDLEEYENIRP